MVFRRVGREAGSGRECCDNGNTYSKYVRSLLWPSTKSTTARYKSRGHNIVEPALRSQDPFRRGVQSYGSDSWLSTTVGHPIGKTGDLSGASRVYRHCRRIDILFLKMSYRFVIWEHYLRSD